MTVGDSAGGFLELTRPGNAVAAGVLTFTGAFVAAGIADPAAVALAVAATVFATGAGNAINDYFDREIDRINRPNRAIPRGAVTARQALAFSILLFLGALVCVLALPPTAITIAAINLLALVAYTELFKGLPGVGNLVVAYLTGSTFLFGGTAVRGSAALTDVGVLVLFALAALATLTREIVKDVEDLAGDREEGLRTLPIVVGERPALWLGVVVMIVAVAASAVPYVLGALGPTYVAIVVPADLLMLAAAAYAFRDPGRGQRLLKVGMFLAAAAFLFGRAIAFGVS